MATTANRAASPSVYVLLTVALVSGTTFAHGTAVHAQHGSDGAPALKTPLRDLRSQAKEHRHE